MSTNRWVIRKIFNYMICTIIYFHFNERLLNDNKQIIKKTFFKHLNISTLCHFYHQPHPKTEKIFVCDGGEYKIWCCRGNHLTLYFTNRSTSDTIFHRSIIRPNRKKNKQEYIHEQKYMILISMFIPLLKTSLIIYIFVVFAVQLIIKNKLI